MKKNNKGFTLIELLAALVILGLLVVIGLPRLTEAITSGRDRVYVSDAKKLIAQTEYKVKVNSSVIELPSDGDCVVVGLKYLDASDFDSPPNDGEYLESQSFTVIKNTNGKFDYSARLVEKYKDKDVFKGVELSKSSSLDYKGGLSCVKSFDDDDISSDVLSMDVDSLKTFVNDKLGSSYCENISNIYNDLDLNDSSTTSVNTIPKITSASLIPSNTTINKSFNTFEADLKLKADDDGGRDNLEVCFKRDECDTIGGFIDQTCLNYSSAADAKGFFKYHFNFSDGTLSYNDDNDPFCVYVTVYDAQRGYTRRQLKYEVHKNEAPVINKETSKISAVDGSEINGFNTVITLDVSDDITDVGDLLVCFEQDDDGTCTGGDADKYYKKYSELFGSGNRMDYLIKGDTLDGSSHAVKVFVKDGYGVEADPLSLFYVLHKNQIPDFQEQGNGSHVTITPLRYRKVTDNSLKVRVSFNLLNELGDVANKYIRVKIEELNCISNSSLQCSRVYAYNPSGDGYDYLFGGDRSNNQSSYRYDGAKRKLKVTVYDERDPSNANYEIVDYQIYQDKEPEISNFVVTPDAYDPCVFDDLRNIKYRCDIYNRNSRLINYSFNIVDDIDNASDLKICISENMSDCTSSDLNYSSVYSDGKVLFYHNLYTFNSLDLKPYFGDVKNLYVYVKDTYGNVSNASIADGYKLYSNEAPFIDLLEISDHGDNNVNSGSFNISITPTLYSNDHLMFDSRDHGGSYYFADDLTDNRYLAYDFKLDDYSIRIDDTNFSSYEYPEEFLKLTPEDISRLKADPNTDWDKVLTFDKLLNQSFNINLNPNFYSYDGRILKFDLSLTDSYGETSDFTSEYQLYNNKPPEIDRFSISSSDPACESCGNEGGYSVYVDLAASDDLDDSNNLFVCLSEELDTCNDSDYISYQEFFKNKLYNYVFKGANSFAPYNGETKKLYVSVRDSAYGKTYDELEYTVYNNTAPVLSGDPSVNSQNSNFNSRSIIFNQKVDDDFDQLYERICYAPVDEFGVAVSEYNCSYSFQPYDEHFKTTLGLSEYLGQTFSVYAEIKDNYDKVVMTNKVLYDVYEDVAPQILDVSGKIGVTNYAPGSGVVSFKVKDYGDLYYICIAPASAGNNACSNYYSVAYDGSDSKIYSYVLESGAVANTDFKLYVSDSHGNKDSKTFKFTNYNSQDKCLNPLTDYKYVTYTPVNNSNVINADRCSGRCYYWPEEKKNGKVVKEASDTVKITAPYKKTISYRSKFEETQFCNATTENVTLNCGSLECFNTGSSGVKNYSNNYVIGLEENYAVEEFSYLDYHSNEFVNYQKGTTYYKVYTTRYNEGDEYITLFPTSYTISADRANEYNYENSSDGNKYLRALDSDDIKLSKPAMNYATSKVVVNNGGGNISLGDSATILGQPFHVVSVNANEVALLSDYNYRYGSYFDDNHLSSNTFQVTCVQDPDAKGFNTLDNRLKGVISFTWNNYWFDRNTNSLYSQYGNMYPAYVFEKEQTVSCIDYLSSNYNKYYINFNNFRFLKYDEARALGCTSHEGSCPSWMSNSTFWLGDAKDSENVYIINYGGFLSYKKYDDGLYAGQRYVVTFDKSEVSVK